MEFKIYKLSYYMNAQHSMDALKDTAHFHTFMISLFIENLDQTQLLSFSKMNQIMDTFLEKYSGNYLNELEEFRTLVPSIENIGEVFYEELKVILHKVQLDLIKLDISETPLRIYSISDRLYLGTKPVELN